MPLPETLPKASSRKKAGKKRDEEPTSSRRSSVQTTTGETTVLFPVTSLWASDVSSNAMSSAVQERYLVDHHRGNEFEYRDEGDEYTDDRNTIDDESFMSYLNNSIVSRDSMTESVSVSGSETSSKSSYSEIYEPRIIQQQRQAARARVMRRENDAIALAGIPEDEPLGSIEATIKEKTQKKKTVTSWRRLFKRHRNQKGVVVPDSSIDKASIRKHLVYDKETEEERDSNQDDDQSALQKSYTLAKNILETNDVDTSTHMDDLPPNEAAPVAAAGAGWLAISSWFSTDAEDQDAPLTKRDPDGAVASIEQNIQKQNEVQSNCDRKGSDDSLFNDLVSERDNQDDAKCTVDPHTKDEERKVSTSRKGCSIPAILPLPTSFLKKKREVRTQQQKQQQRILSILESEELSTHLARNPPLERALLEQQTDNENFSLNPASSKDVFTASSQMAGERKTESAASKMKSRRIMKWPAARPRSPYNEAIPESKDETLDDEGDFLIREHSNDEEYVKYKRYVAASQLGKNHLRNIVLNAKAERLIHQSAYQGEVDAPKTDSDPFLMRELERDSEPEPEWEPAEECHSDQHQYNGKRKDANSMFRTRRVQREMEKISNRDVPKLQSVPTSNEEYLGKKKTFRSIVEEKRMLKEMNKIVKRRLKALEDIEKDAIDSDSQQSLCLGFFCCQE